MGGGHAARNSGRLRAALLVLCAAWGSWAAVANAATVSAEVALDAAKGPVPLPNGPSSGVGVAVGGYDDLMWISGSPPEVYIAQLDPTTTLPIGTGRAAVRLTSGSHLSLSGPSLATDGSTSVVAAWTETGAAGKELRIARLNPTTLAPMSAADANGLTVAAPSAAGGTLTWDGQNYLVTTSTYNSTTLSSSCSVMRLDLATGAPLAADVNGVACPFAATPTYACATASPGGCLYMFSTPTGEMASRFDATSGQFGAPFALPFAVSGGLRVGWDGARYLVLTSQSSSFGAVEGAFLSGQTFGSPFTFGEWMQPNGLVFDGTRYVFDDGVELVTFLPNADTTGIFARTAPIRFGQFGFEDPVNLSAASGGITLVTSLYVTNGSEAEIYGARFNEATGHAVSADTSANISGVALSTGANFEIASSVVGDGAGHVWTGWVDSRDEPLLLASAATASASFYGAPLDATGAATKETMLGATPAPTMFGGLGATGQTGLSASAAENGAALFASLGSTNVQLTKLAADGSTLMTGTLPLPPSTGVTLQPSAVGLAYGNGSYLLVVDQVGLYVQILDAVTLAPKTSGWTTLLSTASSASSIDIAFGGTSFFVTWVVGTAGYEGTEIHGARVATDGTRLDPNGTTLATRIAAANVAIATHAGQYLVAWSDEESDLATADVVGLIVAADGTASGAPFVIAGGAGNQSFVDVVDSGDGLTYQVAWQDDRNGNLDIYGTLVQHTGAVREPGGDALASTADGETLPHLASQGPGTVVLTYERGSDALRLYSRLLSTGDAAGKCTTSDQCASLACRDGYCCDQPCDGACETCAAVPGTCTPVKSAVDPDTCSGAMTCNAAGSCTEVLAKTCAAASDCASGFCVEGVCCDTACSGICATCSTTPGTCTASVAGTTGRSPSCLPYVCDGKAQSCPSVCTADVDCVRPYTCGADGKCELSSGSRCVDSETLKSPNGDLVSCLPYICTNGNCRQSCASIADCSVGLVCDDAQHCIRDSTSSLASGCEAGATNGSVGGAWLVAAVGVLVRRRRRRGK